MKKRTIQPTQTPTHEQKAVLSVFYRVESANPRVGNCSLIGKALVRYTAKGRLLEKVRLIRTVEF